MSRLAAACLILLLASSTFGQGGETVCAKHIEVPEYGRMARLARLEGKVTLSITIDADGKVIQAKGTGAHQLLRDQSEKNILLWTFTKPTHAPAVQTMVYEYVLEGPPLENYYSHATFDLPDHVTISSRFPKPDH
jgi:hypothetical protein